MNPHTIGREKISAVTPTETACVKVRKRYYSVQWSYSVIMYIIAHKCTYMCIIVYECVFSILSKGAPIHELLSRMQESCRSINIHTIMYT